MQPAAALEAQADFSGIETAFKVISVLGRLLLWIILIPIIGVLAVTMLGGPLLIVMGVVFVGFLFAGIGD